MPGIVLGTGDVSPGSVDIGTALTEVTGLHMECQVNKPLH